MSIVVNRPTGEVKSTKLSPEQSQKAWETIIRAFAEKNKALLKEVK